MRRGEGNLPFSIWFASHLRLGCISCPTNAKSMLGNVIENTYNYDILIKYF